MSRQIIPAAHHVDSTYALRSESRLKEYLTYCQSEYNIQPDLATLIAACLIPCYPHRPVWLVIETLRHPFWVHLAAALESLKLPHIYDCATLRYNGAASASYAAKNMAVWLETRDEAPRITVDTRADTRLCWRGMHIYHPYWLLCTESVRAFYPVEMLRLPPEGAELELGRLLKLVIDNTEFRRLRPNPVELPQPVRTLLKGLSSINRELNLGPTLYANLALIPSSHAVLHGRNTLDTSDWGLLRTILAGSIKQWHATFLKYFYDHVMCYAPVRHTVHSHLRVSMLPTLEKINQHIWPQVGLPATKKWLEPLMGYGIVKQIRHGGERLHDVTEYGEMLANLIYDPDFDILDDLQVEPEKRHDKRVGKRMQRILDNEP